MSLVPDPPLEDVPIARQLQELINHFKTLKPNAVVNEKSCTEEFDVNAQQVEAIQNLATKISLIMHSSISGEKEQ